MPRCINEIELIGAAIAGRIVQGYALRLDRNATFPLEVHRIQHLLGHFPLAQAAANLDETISEGRFAVINMGDDRKIANVIHEFQRRRVAVQSFPAAQSVRQAQSSLRRLGARARGIGFKF